MVAPCPVCSKFFSTFRKLKCHITFYHPSVTSFDCPSAGCLRSFQLFNSFRRHYCTTHFSRVKSTEVESVSAKNACVPLADAPEIAGPSSRSTAETPIDETLALLLSSLYANPQVPNNIVDNVYNGVRDLIEKSIAPLLKGDDSNIIKDRIFYNLSKHDSHYKRLKYFKELGTYIEPNPYVVGMRYDFVKRGGVRAYEAVECVGHVIPLRIVLKKFFSIPKLLKITLTHLQELIRHDSTETIEHFIHGSLWRSRMVQNGNKLVMPFFLQVDDFEPLNALGSHSSIHKLGAAYVSLPCLPHYYSSQLSNIFLVLLYHTSDRVLFGNRIIFQPLIDEFNYLSEYGIHFDLPDFNGTVFFELGLILGDNLGIHSITGFVESFSSNYSCRNCKVDKQVMIKQFREDGTLLRNMDNYWEDLSSDKPSLTGIKEKCIWLRVQYFNLFDQIGVDVMHDLYEGVMKYVMNALLITFIDKLKYFGIQLLNNKLASFDYGPDNANIPVSLSLDNLRKGNLRLTASETAVFYRYFGIMFGDLVPQENKYWAIYIQMMLVVDAVMSSGFRPQKTTYFQHLIAELCEMYVSMFHQTLKPKFHNLLHYHRAMLKFGPLRYLSSMRFEAKHRPNKLASKSSSNRINMTFTIAKSHQLMLNDVFLKAELKKSLSFGVETNVPRSEACILLQKFSWTDIDKIKSVSWATVSSLRYRIGCVIVSCIGTDTVEFATISDVYVYNSCKLAFIASPMETIAFDEHYYAYNVRNADSDMQPVYISYDSMSYPFPCNLAIVGSSLQPSQYVILRKPL